MECRPELRVDATHIRARLGLLAMGAVAAATIVGLSMGGGSPIALQSSETIQLGSGSDAVLSGRDFVPLTSSGDPTSVAARRELSGLYAAAGRQMKSRGARQQELAEVSGSFARPQTQIDPGSRMRLNAAAHGHLEAFSHRSFPEDADELRRERSERALGDTIAKYFRSEQKM